MTTKEYTGYVEKLLAAGLTEEAADSLLTLMDSKNNEELRAQAILLSGQYQDILEKQRLALDDDRFGMARVNHALIELNRDVAKQYGDENVPTEIGSRLLSAFHKTPEPNVDQSYNFKKIGILGAGLLLVVFAVFFYFNSTKKPVVPDYPTAVPSNEISHTTHSVASESKEQTQADGGRVDEKPAYIDMTAKVRNIELLETRYFPTNGDGKVIFMFKFYCVADRTGGCVAFSGNFALEINEKMYDPIKTESPLISPNSDGLVVVEFKVPYGYTKMALKIGEMLGSSTLINPMTFQVDLSKKTTPVQKPIVLNYNTEKDLNISKDFGFVKIYSVIVRPYSDNDVEVVIRFYKNYHPDYYNKCLRIVTDDHWRIAPYQQKELEKLKDAIEYEYAFKVPRTTRTAIFTVGDCETNHPPISVPLNL